MELTIIDGTVHIALTVQDQAASQAAHYAALAQTAADEAGLSAYEIAVNNGFIGSEAQWLWSLKGETGEPGYSYVFDNALVADVRVLADEDAHQILLFTADFPVTCTVPPGLLPNRRFEGKQLGTGKITFVPGTGVTLRVSEGENPVTSGQYSPFFIDWIGAEEYLLYGKLESI